MTFITAATVRFKELVEVFLAVVVGKFFASLDVLNGVDLHLASNDAGFAIRATGVVDVAGGIVVFLSVDRPLGIDIEQIAAATAIGFFIGDLLAGVFDNKGPFLDIDVGKESETGPRPGPLYGK